VWYKVPERSTLILEIPKFHYNTVWDRWKEVFVPGKYTAQTFTKKIK